MTKKFYDQIIDAQASQDSRVCFTCMTRKPLTEFHKEKRRLNGRRYQCKSCTLEKCRRYRQQPHIRERIKEWSRQRYQNPQQKVRQRFAVILYRYGITKEQYDGLLKVQGGGCAICNRTSKRFFVDHSHKHDRVRGILCPSCNTAIGLLQDNPRIILKAADYVVNNQANLSRP